MLVKSDEWCAVTKAEAFPSAANEGMDLRVFLQDEVWVSDLGVVHRLDELSEDYLQEIMRYCFDNAEQLQEDILQWFGVNMMLAQEGVLSPSPAQLEAYAAEAIAAVEAEPVEWLRDTSLMKRIVSV